MSCADIQDSLVEFLLHELDEADKTIIESHLASGCPNCQSELRHLSQSMDILWQSIPSPPLPDSMRERILNTCVKAPCIPKVTPSITSSSVTSKTSQPRRGTIGELLLAFAAGGLLMVGLRAIPTRPPTFEPSNPAARVLLPRPDSLISGLGKRDAADTMEMSEKRFKKTRFVALHRPSKSSDLNGQLLWDKLSREIHIYCFGLNAPPADMQYTLWLVGRNKTVRILDEMKIDERGDCRAVAPWPAGDYQYVQVALSRRSDVDKLVAQDIALTSDALPASEY